MPIHVNFPPPCAAVNKLRDQSAEKTLVAEAMEDVGEHRMKGMRVTQTLVFFSLGNVRAMKRDLETV